MKVANEIPKTTTLSHLDSKVIYDSSTIFK